MIDGGYVDEYGQPKKKSNGDLTSNGSLYNDYLRDCVNLIDVIHDNTQTFNSEFTSRCYLDKYDRKAYADGTIATMSEQEVAQRNATVYNFDDLEIAYQVQDGTFDDSPDAGKVYAQAGVDLGNRVPTLLERFRIQRLDEVLLDSMAEDLTGDYGVDQTPPTSFATSASSQVVYNNSIIGANPYADSSNIPCDSRTVDLGINTGYVSGSAVNVRLCAVPNISSTGSESSPTSNYFIAKSDNMAIVNSRVSGAWFALAEAAAKQGITLSANSTFRTNKHQKDLYNSPARKIGSVASPGYSSHQAGVAIDFKNMGGIGFKSTGKCSGGLRAVSNTAGYKWLVANASTYGFSQFSKESWHWDVLAGSFTSRCTDGEGLPASFITTTPTVAPPGGAGTTTPTVAPPGGRGAIVR